MWFVQMITFTSSEAGTFNIDESTIEGKGTLYAGRGVTVDLTSGDVLFVTLVILKKIMTLHSMRVWN